jgi:hypothetical protein
MRRNTFLVIFALLASFISADYFGNLYSKLAPNTLNGAWIGGSSWEFVIGFPFAYILFVTLFIGIYGSGNKNKWIIWLLVPALLFFASGDIKHIYLPILLALLSFGLATLLQKLFKKSPTQNLN